MINIRYDTLFTIELLHSFFANGRCPDFIIRPSPQTDAALKGYKITTKQFENTLYAGIETDENHHPSLALPENMQFTFFLQLLNPQFYVYTSLPSLFAGNSVYYFTNRTNNSNNGKSFLSQPTPYSNSLTYKPNDISVKADGTTYRALRTVKNITPVTGDDWMEVDANRYATGADALPVLPAKSTYTFAMPQSSAVIKVRGFNPAAPDAYSSLVYEKTVPFDTPVSSFTLNLGSLLPGKYKVKVNGDAEQTVYINDELNTAQTFAVIELYSESNLPDAYRMLDGNVLHSPLYSLSFISRATIWKYAMMSLGGTIHDNNNVYAFSVPSAGIVSSLKPIPLSDKALNLKLSVGSQEYSPIACATPQRLSRFTTPTDVYDCSEIFLNY